MTKFMFRAGAAALVLCGALLAPTVNAHANDRYATKPPVTLSPNLAAPWVMQLQAPGGRVAPVQQAERQVVVRRQSGNRQVYDPSTLAAQQAALAPKSKAKRQVDPMYLPQTVAYNGGHAPGTLVVDTRDRFLYLVNSDGTALRYGVGVGKAGFEWSGTEKITRKAEWPSWRPPASMIAREKKKGRHLPTYMAGGPSNPLGARALYLGNTLYRIHGTNQPWSIGQAVSSGCIRMRNEDVTDLYTRVKVGAKVVVL
ncbi:MAG: L,D-transpeptidase [Pseudomonadota bacterium]